MVLSEEKEIIPESSATGAEIVGIENDLSPERQLIEKKEKMELVEAAKDIKELIDLVNRPDFGSIECGDSICNPDQIAYSISETNHFLINNQSSVIASEIVGRKDSLAKIFANKFQSIPSDDLGIKVKARQLMKEFMVNQFESDPIQYTEKAIAQTASFEELLKIFSQFKKNEKGNVVIGGIIREDLIESIEEIKNQITKLGDSGKFSGMSETEVKNEIQSLITQQYFGKIPPIYNIDQKVAELLYDSATQKMEAKIEPAENRSVEKKVGFLSKLFRFRKK